MQVMQAPQSVRGYVMDREHMNQSPGKLVCPGALPAYINRLIYSAYAGRISGGPNGAAVDDISAITAVLKCYPRYLIPTNVGVRMVRTQAFIVDL